MKKHLYPVTAAVILIAFTIYIALDTFVISESYNSNATEMNTAMFYSVSDNSNTAQTSQEETGYDLTDGTLIGSITNDDYSINLYEYYENDTKIYAADITLSSTQYLKTAFANDSYGKNITETTSSIAESNNAVFAINGDYYGVQESGYVIRNGVVYRDTANGSDVLCIYADGTMEIVNDSEYSASELVKSGVWQAFCFGPALLQNGTVSVDVDSEVSKAKSSNPRTAIGVIDENHFVFVVSDGRTDESEGLSLYELAQFMQKLGVKTAYNLDGGGSSTMYFDGTVINNPTSGRSIKEREVSDIIYIG